jgi:hypothetical protein
MGLSVTILTKSEFAARLKISSARVSQFLSQGLPVRSDGRIDLVRALKWCKANILGPAGARAGDLLRETESNDEPNPVDACVNAALGMLFMQLPGVAAAAARDAGAPPEIVDKIAALAHSKAEEAADVVMESLLGMETRDWPDLPFCKEFSVLS